MKSKYKIFSFALLVMTVSLLLIVSVRAWSDIGVERYDDFDDNPGTWDEDKNKAIEGGTQGMYDMVIIFIIENVDQSAHTYKIRIDYDSYTALGPETLQVYYGWGSSGEWIWICNCDWWLGDMKITVADATSSVLQVKFIDTSSLDFKCDGWIFGREPELWMYWN
ncbi:MAG: hypothetical protein ACQET3_09670 [Promethearchaeati archaeon]